MRLAPRRPLLSNQESATLSLETPNCQKAVEYSSRADVPQPVRHRHIPRYRASVLGRDRSLQPPSACFEDSDESMPSLVSAASFRSRDLRAQRAPATACFDLSANQCWHAGRHPAHWGAGRREADGGQPRPYGPLLSVFVPPQGLRVSRTEPGPPLLPRSGARWPGRPVHR